MLERRDTAHGLRVVGGSRPGVQTRSAGIKRIITGYAAVFHRADDPATEYQLGDGVVERVMPTAFRDIRSGDVACLLNHNPDLVLARSVGGHGTLKLSTDRIGLKYEFEPPDTELGRSLVQAVERGDIRGSSFGFMPHDARWRHEPGGLLVRELHNVALRDVSPVTFPAYLATSVGARSGPLRDRQPATTAPDLWHRLGSYLDRADAVAEEEEAGRTTAQRLAFYRRRAAQVTEMEADAGRGKARRLAAYRERARRVLVAG